MNTFNINDLNFINSETYENFIIKNPSSGNLRVRAYAASGAIPISGLKVVVSKVIDNNNVIFYEGYTNSSGVIDRIPLPAPKLDTDDLNIPNFTTYDIVATYIPDNVNLLFKVNMYEDVYVVQNINIVPDMNSNMGGSSGS